MTGLVFLIAPLCLLIQNRMQLAGYKQGQMQQQNSAAFSHVIMTDFHVVSLFYFFSRIRPNIVLKDTNWLFLLFLMCFWLKIEAYFFRQPSILYVYIRVSTYNHKGSILCSTYWFFIQIYIWTSDVSLPTFHYYMLGFNSFWITSDRKL